MYTTCSANSRGLTVWHTAPLPEEGATAFRDLVKFLRDPARLLATFIFPLLFIVILGGSFQANLGERAGFDFLAFTFTGVCQGELCEIRDDPCRESSWTPFQQILRLPTVIIDITTYSETGYVGQDPSTILTRLLHAADDNPLLASIGVVCLDEFDKLASTEVRAVDEQLRHRNLPPIPTTHASLDLPRNGTTASLRCDTPRLTDCIPARPAAATELR